MGDHGIGSSEATGLGRVQADSVACGPLQFTKVATH